MPERTSYAQGTPSWVDLGAPDVDVAAEFYGALFGWEATPATDPPEASGGYRIFSLRGKRVGGVAPLMAPDQPPAWTTYIAVDDADAVVAKVVKQGGLVIVPAMDVMEAGRMACFIDPTGAFVGIWQAGENTGAEVVNEPGTFGWNELVTRDVKAAKTFYTKVFGVEAAPWENAGSHYTVWNVDGRTVGGLLEMDDRWPAEVPAHWMTYFQVEDADATASMAEMLGGAIVVEPFDVPNIGRIGVLKDPGGAAFSVMASALPAADG
jgi:predicted enzyme related to lactoylglutathione lyase